MRTFSVTTAVAATLTALGTGTLLLPVLGTAAAAPAPVCRGERATIVGTDGRDLLVGTPGRDVIVGLGGHDDLRGLGGNDVQCGGRGADVLEGGRGDDRLYGGPDWVEGGETPYHRGDWLEGGPGDDLLAAGEDPRWTGEGGGDWVSWTGSARGVQVDLPRGTATGQGRDRVRLTDGRVYLTPHDDSFVGSSGPDEVHGLAGSDDVRTGGGDDTVWLDDVEELDDDRAWTGDGRDDVWSGGGSDVVRSHGGRDALHLVGEQGLVRTWAGSGNDLVEVLMPPRGDHVLVGGTGQDRLRVELLGEPGDHTYDLVTGRLLLGPDELESRAPGFEDAELYQGRFTVLGTDGPNHVVVNLAGTFEGRGGDDRFSGSPFDDTFDGGPGDDTYAYDEGGTNTCTSVESDPLGACPVP